MNYNPSISIRVIFSLIVCIFLVSIFETIFSTMNCTAYFSINDIREVLSDMANHNSFEYQNRGVLTEKYFITASGFLNDEAVYLILSNTETASSRIISLFTKNEFNHISLSFDYRLETTVSYNGGNRIYSPGLNPENCDDLIKTKDSSALVYRLEVTGAQKRAILNRVRSINDEGSSYNILGLILNRSWKPNIMFCSQFVYSVLEETGAQYFPIGNDIIKPSDFIEKDYHRKLKFCYEL